MQADEERKEKKRGKKVSIKKLIKSKNDEESINLSDRLSENC